MAPEPDDHTFREFYLKVYLPTVAMQSQSWLDQIANCMDNWFLPEFGHRDIRAVTRAEIQSAFNRWPLALTSKQKYKIVVSGVFNLAVDDEVIARNPAAKVRIPKPPPTEKTALTPEQLCHLYELSEGRARKCVILAGFMSLRFGECLGVSKASISREGVLHVQRQVLQFTKSKVESMPKAQYEERRGGAVLTAKLKTSQSVRKIPVPKAFLAELRSGDSLWVVPDANGKWSLPNNVEREFSELVKLAQEKDHDFPRITMHELRHTWLTIMESHLECPDSIRLELAGKANQSKDSGYVHPHMERKRVWQEKYHELVSTSHVVKGVVKLA